MQAAQGLHRADAVVTDAQLPAEQLDQVTGGLVADLQAPLPSSGLNAYQYHSRQHDRRA